MKGFFEYKTKIKPAGNNVLGWRGGGVGPYNYHHHCKNLVFIGGHFFFKFYIFYLGVSAKVFSFNVSPSICNSQSHTHAHFVIKKYSGRKSRLDSVCVCVWIIHPFFLIISFLYFIYTHSFVICVLLGEKKKTSYFVLFVWVKKQTLFLKLIN